LPTNLKDTEVRYGVIDIETFRSKDNADVPKGQLVPYHVGVYTGKANVKNGNTFLTWYYTDYGSADQFMEAVFDHLFEGLFSNNATLFAHNLGKFDIYIYY